jgi:simple sugar transport system substrate-binding protein
LPDTRRRFSWIVAALVAAVTALVAVGCGSSDSGGSSSNSGTSKDKVSLTQGKDLTFAMVTHGDAGSFWAVVKKGAEQAAKDEGVKLDYTESNNDPQKQAQMIQAAVTQKVDGIAVSAPNPDAIKGALAKAKAAGIPIITLNSGSDVYQQLGAITHVGQDEKIAGQAAGARIKQAGGKKVLCIIHEQGNVGLNQRCDGVKQGFGGTVDNLQVKGTNALSTTQTEIKSKLQADKSYDWVLALNPDIATTAATAVKAASSSAKLATFDLSGDVVKAIKAGTVQFAVDQQQYLQGYLPVVFLTLFKTNANTVGGGQPVLTGPGFVDKANAATVEQLASQGTR